MTATMTSDTGSVTVPHGITDVASFREWIESDEAAAKCKPWLLLGKVWIETARGLVTIPPGISDLDSYLEWRQSDDVPEKLEVCYLKGDIRVDLAMEELFTHTHCSSSNSRA